MSPDFTVQTGQDARSSGEQGSDTGNNLAVCLRAPRSGKLRVVLVGSAEQRELSFAGWEVADDIALRGACACGCGLPVPFRLNPDTIDRVTGSPIQRYADPEACRRELYSLQHPTLDLSGMPPVQAKHAARMAGEAVRAAKLGQTRATVDARVEVVHAVEDKRGPDNRPSCRLRLSPGHWRMLAEIQELGFRGGMSFSGLVSQLIEEELDLCRTRYRQEGEQDA